MYCIRLTRKKHDNEHELQAKQDTSFANYILQWTKIRIIAEKLDRCKSQPETKKEDPEL